MFPPVIPDPPLTPGRAVIEVPDIVAKHKPDNDDAGGDTEEATNAAFASD